MGTEACPICLVADAEAATQLNHIQPCCKQRFHKECIEEWFRVSTTKTCPLCRNFDEKHKKQLLEIRKKMRVQIRSDSVSIVLGDENSSERPQEKCKLQ